MHEKTQLINNLGDEFNHWEEFLASLNEGQIAAPNRIEKLSVKDIVAHLTVWQKISVERLEAAQYGRKPEYPKWHGEYDPVTGEELAVINFWIYEARREQTWANVHDEWRVRFLYFLELAKSIPEKDLFETGKYAWLKEYPLSAVLLGSFEHHQEHLDSLLSIFEKKEHSQFTHEG